jgi:hypothetical protein
MPSRKKTTKPKRTAKKTRRTRSRTKSRLDLASWEGTVQGGLSDLYSNLDDIVNELNESDANTRPVQALRDGVEALDEALSDDPIDQDRIHETLGQIAHIETSIYIKQFQKPRSDANDTDFDTRVANWFKAIDGITWDIGNEMNVKGQPATPTGSADQLIVGYFKDICSCVSSILGKLDEHLTRQSK